MPPHEMPVQAHRLNSNPFATSALEGDGSSAPRLSRFTPVKDRVPVVLEVGWVSGPV
jgi:hypothetical protein